MTRALAKRLVVLLALALAAAGTTRASAQEDEASAALDDEDVLEAFDDEEEQTEEDAEEEEQTEEDAEEETDGSVDAVESEAPPERAVAIRASAGLGVGSLSFVRPTRAGSQQLPDTAFAAAGVTLNAHLSPSSPLSLDLLLAYQTSLGFEVEFPPLFALPQQVDVRVQRLEFSAAPVLRLGANPGIALAFPAGVAFRWFVPEVHQYPVTDYIVGGPHARAELRLQLGELVDVHAGPEAQWLALIEGAMHDAGACCHGVALGGQGAVRARVGTMLRVALAYREAHAFVPIGTWRFKDVERWLMLRVSGEL